MTSHTICKCWRLHISNSLSRKIQNVQRAIIRYEYFKKIISVDACFARILTFLPLHSLKPKLFYVILPVCLPHRAFIFLVSDFILMTCQTAPYIPTLLLVQRHPAVTPASYPQVQAPIVNNPAFWERLGLETLGTDTLFFAFYYQQVCFSA